MRDLERSSGVTAFGHSASRYSVAVSVFRVTSRFDFRPTCRCTLGEQYSALPAPGIAFATHFDDDWGLPIQRRAMTAPSPQTALDRLVAGC